VQSLCKCIPWTLSSSSFWRQLCAKLSFPTTVPDVDGLGWDDRSANANVPRNISHECRVFQTIRAQTHLFIRMEVQLPLISSIPRRAHVIKRDLPDGMPSRQEPIKTERKMCMRVS
jgi:hypothetical protein